MHLATVCIFVAIAYAEASLHLPASQTNHAGSVRSTTSYPRHVYLTGFGAFHAVSWFENAPVYFNFDSNGNPSMVVYYSAGAFTLPSDGCPSGNQAWLLTQYSCPPGNCWDVVDHDMNDGATVNAYSVGCARSGLMGNFNLNGNIVTTSTAKGHRWIKNGDDLKFKLIDVQFNTDGLTAGTARPNVLENKNINNLNGDVETHDSLAVSYVVSQTQSWSHSINFGFGIDASFSSGFDLFGDSAKVSMSTSFNFDTSDTFSVDTSKTKIESYTFPLVVPAHTAVSASAAITNVDLTVPYQIVFDVYDDYRITVSGEWKGVAGGAATFTISETTSKDMCDSSICSAWKNMLEVKRTVGLGAALEVLKTSC